MTSLVLVNFSRTLSKVSRDLAIILLAVLSSTAFAAELTNNSSELVGEVSLVLGKAYLCLLYTSPSPRDS